MGWIDDSTVAHVLARPGGERWSTLGVYSYNLRTHVRREILPLGRLRMSAVSVRVSDGARYGFWHSELPGDPDCYRLADLRTGRQLPRLRFPERVTATPSPDGMRVLATGRDTGALYLAKLRAGAPKWEVRRIRPR